MAPPIPMRACMQAPPMRVCRIAHPHPHACVCAGSPIPVTKTARDAPGYEAEVDRVHGLVMSELVALYDRWEKDDELCAWRRPSYPCTGKWSSRLPIDLEWTNDDSLLSSHGSSPRPLLTVPLRVPSSPSHSVPCRHKAEYGWEDRPLVIH